MTGSHGHPGENCHCGPQEPGCEKMIYIGKLPDMDPKEGLFHQYAEKASSTLGGQSYGGSTDPLYGDLVDVHLNDKNGDGVIKTNDKDGLFHRSETITHDATGSDQNYQVDSTFIVKNTVVTFMNADGTTEDVTMSVRVMQDTGGNAFIMPPPSNASDAEIDMMTSRPIVSVNFSDNPRDFDICHDSIFTDRSCFPCFARGTQIETEFGTMAVEDLREGMKVWTLDNGMQPVRWVGSRKLGQTVLTHARNLRPIRISAGALGENVPSRDLVVSPQHRILVRSRIAQKILGCEEVLVAAKQLMQLEGIDVAADLPEVEYFHILFDDHQVIMSDGAASESLYTGPQALLSIGKEARDEIFAIFPQLRDMAKDDMPEGARLLASGRLGRKLAVRHAQNRKALVQA